MASNDEYQQRQNWINQFNQKPGFTPGDDSQHNVNACIYMAEQERKYWFNENRMLNPFPQSTWKETIKLSGTTKSEWEFSHIDKNGKKWYTIKLIK